MDVPTTFNEGEVVNDQKTTGACLAALVENVSLLRSAVRSSWHFRSLLASKVTFPLLKLPCHRSPLHRPSQHLHRTSQPRHHCSLDLEHDNSGICRENTCEIGPVQQKYGHGARVEHNSSNAKVRCLQRFDRARLLCICQLVHLNKHLMERLKACRVRLSKCGCALKRCKHNRVVRNHS